MPWNQLGPSMVCLILATTICGAEDPPSDEAPRMVFAGVPEKIDADARYLFYLHGRIIEEHGVRPTHPRYGVYEYEEILRTFADHGFVVISEARPSGTDGKAYATKVVDQVRTLIAGRVPPERITVVGFSRGGGMAILASSLLANDSVNFIFLASCGKYALRNPQIVPRGHILAVREASDRSVGSCRQLLTRAAGAGVRKEIVLKLGGGHGAFYRPQPGWVDPVVEWAEPVD